MTGAGVRTVVALRALGLGDALTGVPALRGVRRAWPRARLVLAGPPETGDWLVREGVVDAVLPARGLDPLPPTALVDAAAALPDVLDGARVDVGVNLHGDGAASATALAALAPARTIALAGTGPGRPGGASGRARGADEHEVDRWCRLVAAATGAPCGRPDLVLRDAPLAGPAGRGARGPVLVHPGAASAARRWPADRFAEVAAALAADGRRVLLTGSAAEAPLCDRVASAAAERLPAGAPVPVSTAGRLDLPALVDLVAGAAVLVCGDTGVAHVATATRTPSVLLFGPVAPATWGPAIDPERHAVLWPAPAPPAPPRAGDPHGTSLDPVLAAIAVAPVVAAARALLSAALP